MAKLDDIHALLDGELEGEEKARALESVQADRCHHNEFLWARLVKDTLKDKCPRHENPELFRACMVRVAEIEKTKKIEMLTGKWAWAACLVVLCIVGAAGISSRLGGPVELDQSNMASLFGRGLVAVPGGEADPQQVVEKAMGPLGCDVRPQGMIVREVAQGSIAGRRASRIRLADRDGQLVMIVIQGIVNFEGQTPSATGYGKGIINGANAVSWSEGGVGFLLMGARSSDRLAEIATSLRAPRP